MSDLSLMDIKKGQVFYECEYGMNIKMTAKKDAVVDENGAVHCVGIKDNGEEVELFHANGFEHYGPKLYSYPAYSNVKQERGLSQ